VFGIIGPNGSGKTTLLERVADLHLPDRDSSTETRSWRDGEPRVSADYSIAKRVLDYFCPAAFTGTFLNTRYVKPPDNKQINFSLSLQLPVSVDTSPWNRSASNGHAHPERPRHLKRDQLTMCSGVSTFTVVATWLASDGKRVAATATLESMSGPTSNVRAPAVRAFDALRLLHRSASTDHGITRVCTRNVPADRSAALRSRASCRCSQPERKQRTHEYSPHVQSL
jgi:energy-coupling factor transporter ATP-binding protein EcfA2